MAIITIQQQQAIKPISPNWAGQIKISGGLTNFEELANEVERKEFRILLGIDMYSDMISNLTESKYLTLINGTEFENYRGNNNTFYGLRYILAYLIYSKYVAISFVSDTFTGMVRKNRQESESLTNDDIKRLQLDAREIALQDFELIKQYLNINYLDYPYWYSADSKRPYIPKLTGIKRTKN